MWNGGKTITNSANTLDTRELQQRIRDLERNEDDLDEVEQEELRTLLALREQFGDIEWRGGIMLINDDYFERYAREYADDIGAINDNTAWPCTCIDWEKAARELQMDYNSVEFDGQTFWYL